MSEWFTYHHYNLRIVLIKLYILPVSRFIYFHMFSSHKLVSFCFRLKNSLLLFLGLVVMNSFSSACLENSISSEGQLFLFKFSLLAVFCCCCFLSALSIYHAPFSSGQQSLCQKVWQSYGGSVVQRSGSLAVCKICLFVFNIWQV